MREVEVRTRISGEARDTVTGHLLNLGFKDLGNRQQVDIIFDRPDGSLFNCGAKIRLRAEDETAELTYKGSLLARPDVSDRTEINVRVPYQEFDNCKAFIEALGFPELFRTYKARQSWERGSVAATLDDWPVIGLVLELEGPEEEIVELAGSFGSGYRFANYRLRDFFDEVQRETGKDLALLQKEYEDRTGRALGRLNLLIA